jgi:SAM-dependent methyltransferase
MKTNFLDSGLKQLRAWWLRVKLVMLLLRPGIDIQTALNTLPYTFKKPVFLPNNRYFYQKPHIRFQFEAGQKILDIGSGGDPFIYATFLADRYLEPTRHRAIDFTSEGKPVVQCDVETIPFADKTFDFTLCAHVLEHVNDPIRACRELQRVSRAGYIETPTLLKDALFGWAKGLHKWHITRIANRLVFVEYDERKAEGIRSNVWDRIIHGTSYHPLQEIFVNNQDLFNVMFEWQDRFEVTVYYLDGSVRASDLVNIDSK